MPKKVILIAAVTLDGYIARHSLEITKWSKDLHLFKEQTYGYPVIMGSNTFKTLQSELENREMIVINRYQSPVDVLSKIKSRVCFVIGGGKTYYRFIPFYTHIFVTPHPYIFGKGVPLFDGNNLKEVDIKFQKFVEVDKKNGIIQYQYSITK